MSVSLIAILAAEQPGYYSQIISDLDTNDPRTQAVKRALAHYHEGVVAKYEDVNFSRFGYIKGSLEIDWGKSFGEIPACMLSFYYEAVRRCVANRDNFPHAVMFLFERLGHRIKMYREHCSEEEINEWIRQVIHDLHIEYQQMSETFEKIHMEL